MAGRFLNHSRPSIAGSDERVVHVGYADLDQMGDTSRAGWDLLAVDVSDDESTVFANPKLSPMCLADADSLLSTDATQEIKSHLRHQSD
jgi:hypothetical protein